MTAPPSSPRRLGDLERAGRELRRREVLVAAGAAGAGVLLVSARGWASIAREAVAAPAASCSLSKELTEGPYWIDGTLTRRDITEGRRGVPLALVLTVRDAATCKMINGADVEVWHSDAAGAYSGFSAGPPSRGPALSAATPQSSQRFLRGHQVTDARGRVRFMTIYPGWYQGRTPHIHLKVHVGGNEVHTGQVFFPDRTSAAVYRTKRYRSHGSADTSNADDSIYEPGSLLKLRRLSGAKGYVAAITLGVEQS